MRRLHKRRTEKLQDLVMPYMLDGVSYEVHPTMVQNAMGQVSERGSIELWPQEENLALSWLQPRQRYFAFNANMLVREGA